MSSLSTGLIGQALQPEDSARLISELGLPKELIELRNSLEMKIRGDSSSRSS